MMNTEDRSNSEWTREVFIQEMIQHIQELELDMEEDQERNPCETQQLTRTTSSGVVYESLQYDFPQLNLDDWLSFRAQLIEAIEMEQWTTFFRDQPLTRRVVDGLIYVNSSMEDSEFSKGFSKAYRGSAANRPSGVSREDGSILLLRLWTELIGRALATQTPLERLVDDAPGRSTASDCLERWLGRFSYSHVHACSITKWKALRVTKWIHQIMDLLNHQILTSVSRVVDDDMNDDRTVQCWYRCWTSYLYLLRDRVIHYPTECKVLFDPMIRHCLLTFETQKDDEMQDLIQDEIQLILAEFAVAERFHQSSTGQRHLLCQLDQLLPKNLLAQCQRLIKTLDTLYRSCESSFPDDLMMEQRTWQRSMHQLNAKILPLLQFYIQPQPTHPPSVLAIAQLSEYGYLRQLLKLVLTQVMLEPVKVGAGPGPGPGDQKDPDPKEEEERRKRKSLVVRSYESSLRLVVTCALNAPEQAKYMSSIPAIMELFSDSSSPALGSSSHHPFHCVFPIESTLWSMALSVELDVTKAIVESFLERATDHEVIVFGQLLLPSLGCIAQHKPVLFKSFQHSVAERMRKHHQPPPAMISQGPSERRRREDDDRHDEQDKQWKRYQRVRNTLKQMVHYSPQHSTSSAHDGSDLKLD